MAPEKKKTTKTKKETDVVKVEETQALAEVEDWGDEAEAGFEDQTQDDLAIPLLNILQPMSPQVTDGDLKAGDLYNNVTEESYDGKKGIYFLFAKTERCVNEWIPRGKGGGFVARHEMNSELVKAKKAQNRLGPWKNGENELIETVYAYGVLLDKDLSPLGPMVLHFTSMKHKPYKAWNQRIRTFLAPTGRKDANGFAIKQRLPMYAHPVLVKTVKQQNSKGTFWNYFFEGAVADDLDKGKLSKNHPAVKAAREMHALATSGAVNMKMESDAPSGGNTEDDEDPPF